jgi:hypothetical protein
MHDPASEVRKGFSKPSQTTKNLMGCLLDAIYRSTVRGLNLGLLPAPACFPGRPLRKGKALVRSWGFACQHSSRSGI